MKTLEEIRTIIREHQNVLAEKYGVAVVAVFCDCLGRTKVTV
jgi:predicted nucleotidyltransferase